MPSEPRRAEPLNRARVLESARELADSEGLDAVSMRSLAARLGVVPMALYKHVSDKDDLVAGMIDSVVASYPPPSEGLEWRSAVRHRVHAAMDAVARHPWLRTAILQSTRQTPTVLAHLDATAGDLASAGFSYDLIHYGMHGLGYRVWGFTPEPFAPRPGTPPAPAPDPETMAALATAFPHVAAIATDAATRNPEGACEADREFDFGLDLLLDALERLHATGWASR